MRGLFSLAAFSLENVFTSHFDIIIIDHRSSIIDLQKPAAHILDPYYIWWS
jgi:exosome complex RNA-binding protein Rrp42 (RNase PH superfamily)